MARGLLASNAKAQRRKGRKGLHPNEASHLLIGASIKVHKTLGPGLLESVYVKCLCHQLALDGVRYQHQVKLPIIYEGIELEGAYWIDLVIEDCLLAEAKSVEHLLPVHFAQVLSYLRLSGHSLGLLINFNVPLLRNGIHRVVNGLKE